MSNAIDVEYNPVEGIHLLDESSYRKYARGLPVRTCENCKKLHGDQGVDVKRCQGCWSIGFCSKDCQVAHWPEHKTQCLTLQAVLTLEHLARNVYSNPFLLHYLRVALILKLNPNPSLLANDGSASPKPTQCLSLFVHMHMHPLSSEHEGKLYLGHIDASNGKEKIPGCLRLGINTEPAETLPLNGRKTSTLTGDNAMSVRLWKQARQTASAAGRQANPILLVNFGYDKDSMTFAIELTADAFETARGNLPPAAIVSTLPLGMEIPSTIGDFQSVLTNIIDKYIELDGEDKLKLRRNLRKVDKVFLRHKALFLIQNEGPSVFKGLDD